MNKVYILTLKWYYGDDKMEFPYCFSSLDKIEDFLRDYSELTKDNEFLCDCDEATVEVQEIDSVQTNSLYEYKRKYVEVDDFHSYFAEWEKVPYEKLTREDDDE